MGVPLILRSAYRHDICEADMLHAFRNVLNFDVQDEGFVMFIGPARDGTLLEVGVVDADEGPVIVHAMRARPKYQPR